MKSFLLIACALVAGAAQADTLWNNGPAVDANGLNIHNGPLAGYVASPNFESAVADNFVVSAGGWRVTDLHVFMWTDQNISQDGGIPNYLFVDLSWSIVSGANVGTGTVVASGTQTAIDNGVVGFNVPAIDLASRRQGIFDVQADIPDITLGAGNYWLSWSLSTLDRVPVSASVAAVVGSTGGNAEGYFRNGAYSPLADAAGRGVELPFTVNGTALAAPVPEPATAASLLAGLGALAALHRRRSN